MCLLTRVHSSKKLHKRFLWCQFDTLKLGFFSGNIFFSLNTILSREKYIYTHFSNSFHHRIERLSMHITAIAVRNGETSLIFMYMMESKLENVLLFYYKSRIEVHRYIWFQVQKLPNLVHFRQFIHAKQNKFCEFYTCCKLRLGMDAG